MIPGSQGWESRMDMPVPVIRLPRGPDGISRGFDLNSPRYQALGLKDYKELKQEQKARTVMREQYLRSLLAMVGQPVCFTMYEKVTVMACFGSADIDILNFQVSELQTPLGVQREALLRCPDIISYTFQLSPQHTGVQQELKEGC